MPFMQEVLEKNIPIWDRCAATPFVQELQKGTLPPEKFKNYIIQDSIYLKHYARIYGKAIYHSTALKDIQLYYSILNFVTDTESAVRLSYLGRFGISDEDIEQVQPWPENLNYINFLLKTAEEGDACGILMTVLPCMLSYSYVFRKIAVQPGTEHSGYLDFIQDYAEEKYYESGLHWIDFAAEKCDALPVRKQAALSRIFEKASLLELAFWEMAYRKEALNGRNRKQRRQLL